MAAAFPGGVVLAESNPSVAFFYGNPVPVVELTRFNWVVVQPDNLDGRDLQYLQNARVHVFAYLSLGEAAPGTVDPSWILGQNAAWGSVIVDPRASGWRTQIVATADALLARGYRGLFLDTLDSYAMVLSGEEEQAAAAAMAGLIRDVGDRDSDMKLFFNRGFELLPDVGSRASAIAAESLFFGWDAAAQQYVNVPSADRAWLAARLHAAQRQFGIPAVVIDYLPESRGADARAAARRMEQMSFVPWIGTPALDTLGVGAGTTLPRVLLLHDGAEARSPVIGLIADRLRALGCAVDLADVRRGLPAGSATHRAGIVTWFTDDDLPEALGYARWLTRQIDAGVPVAMLGRPGFPALKPLLTRLGMDADAAPAAASRAARVVRRDGLIEIEPMLRSRGLLRWRAVGPDVDVHLRIEDAAGLPIDPVVTAPWGGLALQPYLVEFGYEGRTRWIVDPTAFLTKALGLGKGAGTHKTCAPDVAGGRN